MEGPLPDGRNTQQYGANQQWRRFRAGGRSIDANANVINVGAASVDTGNGEPSRRRVSGNNDDPWAVMLALTYNL